MLSPSQWNDLSTATAHFFFQQPPASPVVNQPLRPTNRSHQQVTRYQQQSNTMVRFASEVKAIDNEDNVTTQPLRDDDIGPSSPTHDHEEEGSLSERLGNENDDENAFSESYFDSSLEMSLRGGQAFDTGFLMSDCGVGLDDTTNHSEMDQVGLEVNSTTDTDPSTDGSEEDSDPAKKKDEEEENMDKKIAKEMGKGLLFQGALFLGIPILIAWFTKLFGRCCCRGGNGDDDVAALPLL